MQPRLVEPLAQSFRIRDLELEWRWLVGQAGETRDDRLDGPEKEAKEVDLRRRAVRDHQDAAAPFRHPHHLGERARQVGEEHHAELRRGEVESVVLQLQLVPVHHARLDIEAFG